jgi:class 3 adenylate cyclase
LRGGALVAAALAVAVPALGFALLLAAPDVEFRWEDHPAHFWLVLAAGAMTALLAYSTGESARRRADIRLMWVSLTFLVAAGFLGLHALATPGIFRDASNLGFQIATPVGLAIAGVLATVSAYPPRDHGIWGTSGFNWPRAALIALMVAWGVATIAGLAPLDRITKVERASGVMLVLAIAGAVLYVVASVRYVRLALERQALLPLAVATGFVLLAEALLATSLGRNWHSSWWEWHVLILAAFAIVAWAAQREWREERFASLYTEETAEGSREVSVLFADLAGFTRFAEERDPVEVTRMLNAYFEVAIPPIVREHGGEVDSLIGDAVMATFKSPPEEPDHALRAAHAAIALRDGTARLADEHPDWPRFRIGVNTGEAVVGVVGTGGGRSYTVIGDAVNVAARLESAAPVGGIAVGPETARRLRGSRLSPLGDLHVKGRREPLDAFVLHGFEDRDD